jgi:transcriptional regulator with XRE-family HTH domain
VASNLSEGIAFQIRATRDKQNMSQIDLAREAGMTPNNLSRLESPDYGKQTISSIKRIAEALDVALVVRQYIDWLSGTPRIDEGISPNSLAVPSFEKEEQENIIETSQFQKQLTEISSGMLVNFQLHFGTKGIGTSSTWDQAGYEETLMSPVPANLPEIGKPLETSVPSPQPFIQASLN